MTHAAPRNGQPAKLASSKSHTAAIVALLGYVPTPAVFVEPSVKLEAGLKPAPGDPAASGGAPPKPAPERVVKQPRSEPRAAPVPKNHESRNFGGHDARHINYRGMKLAFSNAQVGHLPMVTSHGHCPSATAPLATATRPLPPGCCPFGCCPFGCCPLAAALRLCGAPYSPELGWLLTQVLLVRDRAARGGRR